MSGLIQIRNLIASLRNPAHVHEYDDVVRRLEEIEAMLVAEHAGGGRPRGDGLSAQRRETLEAMISLGGAGTPMQIGSAIDPSLDGYRAGGIATNRLGSLKRAGLVRKAHFGWWEITEEGRLALQREP